VNPWIQGPFFYAVIKLHAGGEMAFRRTKEVKNADQ
jgi:hypothetical protein